MLSNAAILRRVFAEWLKICFARPFSGVVGGRSELSFRLNLVINPMAVFDFRRGKAREVSIMLCPALPGLPCSWSIINGVTRDLQLGFTVTVLLYAISFGLAVSKQDP